MTSTHDSQQASSIAQLNLQDLNDYLQEHVAGFSGLQSAEKFAGGQSNPTFLLTADSGKYVLRRKPPGQLLPSAHAVDREFSVIKALRETPVPVATAHHLCEDDSIIGSMFYVMSFEDGRIFWNPAFPEVSSNDQRQSLHKEMIRVLADLHNIDVKTVGLDNYGKPGNYFERQISRWIKQYRSAETERIEAMEKLISWLPDNIPEDDGQTSLIHGDFRMDNVMFDHNNSKAIAVLDWELSTLGHPLADLGYYCMCLRLPNVGDIKGLEGVDRESLGIPTEKELIQQYCDLRNIEGINNWNFYLSFSYFRLAAIVQGVYKRAINGNASNEKAMSLGKVTRLLVDMALPLIDE